jgi:GNAT superfamily N-acetyltransferase
LGDLAPEELTHCEWRFTSHDPPAVTLFYRAFDPPVFFAIGSAVAVERLLDEAPLPPSVYVHIRPEILRLVSERYQRVMTKMMQRMILREPALADFTGVGNVFCLPEYRGKGLGARVTSAIVSALIKEDIQTIGLNVVLESPATKLYHRLGFRKACSYVEGIASRIADSQ